MAIDYFEALGAKRPEEPVGGSQEEGKEENNNEQQLADAAETDGEENPENPENDNSEGEPEKKPQTKEERQRFAQQRRKQEMDEAISKAKEEMMAQFREENAKMRDEVISGLHIMNTFTGKPVTTQAEYDAFVYERDKQEAEDGFRRAGLDDDTVSKLLSTHPAVMEAERLKATAQKELNSTLDARSQQKAAEQLEEIQKLDPAIKSMEDVIAMESYPRIRKLVKTGEVSISEAFALVESANIESRKVAAAKQEALNLANGKNHLGIDTSRGNTPSQVPAGVRRQYENLYGGKLSTAEIQKKYDAFLKAQKKG